MLAAYSLTVKPTGLAIMALVGTAWLTGAALNVIQSWKAGTNPSLRYMIFGFCTFCLVYIFFAVICFNSDYLSSKNILFAISGQQILQEDFSALINWRDQSTFVYFSLGVCFPLSVTIIIIYASLHSRLRSIVLTEYAWSVGCSVTYLASGCWIWLVSSNGTQFRYFYPFVFASFIFAAPSIARAFSLAPGFVRALSIALFLAPLSWTTLFLVIPDDEAEARLVGMVLNAGPASEEDQKAEQFVKYLRKAGRLRSAIYYISLWWSGARSVFRCATFENMIRRSETTFSMEGPVTWTSSSVVRIDNIIGSDFILISRIDDERHRLNLISTKSVGDLYTEVDVLRAWGTVLGQKDGVVEVLSTQSAVIYEIVDRQALKRSLQSLVQGRSWRKEFLCKFTEILDVCFISPTPVERHARAGGHPVPMPLVSLDSRFRGNDARIQVLAVYLRNGHLAIRIHGEARETRVAKVGPA